MPPHRKIDPRIEQRIKDVSEAPACPPHAMCHPCTGRQRITDVSDPNPPAYCCAACHGLEFPAGWPLQWRLSAASVHAWRLAAGAMFLPSIIYRYPPSRIPHYLRSRSQPGEVSALPNNTHPLESTGTPHSSRPPETAKTYLVLTDPHIHLVPQLKAFAKLLHGMLYPPSPSRSPLQLKASAKSHLGLQEFSEALSCLDLAIDLNTSSYKVRQQ